MQATNLKNGEMFGLFSESWAMTALCCTGKPGAKGVICHPLDADFVVSSDGRDVYFRVEK